MPDQRHTLLMASEDFAAAHRKAKLKALLAHITGERFHLLSFDEISQKYKFLGSSDAGTQDIPIDSIVGSVGRYLDFTRDFLPLQGSDRQRWAGVKAAMLSELGVPPIDVYKLGDLYFIKDGNHRVSVAKQFGATHIQANVVETHINVTLKPNDSPDDLILSVELSEFLEKTKLDVQRPGMDLKVTVPGSYQELLQQIALHHFDLIQENGPETPYQQAATGWYDEIYLPTIQIIRDQDILRAFPSHTQTDLYLSITSHRDELEKTLSMEAKPENAAFDFARRFGPRWTQFKIWLSEQTLLNKFEPGPEPGSWRKRAPGKEAENRLFRQILVPVDRLEDNWSVLDQAAVIARRDQGQINGLHVLTGKENNHHATANLHLLFNQHCNDNKVDGHLVIAVGNVTRQISIRANLADILVLKLNHPPALRGIARLRSGLRDLIRRAPCPLLITSGRTSPLNKALVAYDGSPRADEALYLAAMISRSWQIPFVVLHVDDGRENPEKPLDRARRILRDHDVQVEFASAKGFRARNILLSCEEYDCDFIIVGGYGRAVLSEVLLGSTVDRIILYTRLPVLICQ